MGSKGNVITNINGKIIETIYGSSIFINTIKDWLSKQKYVVYFCSFDKKNYHIYMSKNNKQKYEKYKNKNYNS
jgi:hypothetical protein